MNTNNIRVPFTVLLVAVIVNSVLQESVWAWQNIDSPIPGANTLYSFEKGGLLFRALLISQEQMSRSTAQHLAERMFFETSKFSYAEVVMAANETDLRQSYFGTHVPLETEPSFCDTIAALGRRVQLSQSGIARLIRVQGAGLFTYRAAGRGNISKPGIQEELLGRGIDPTQFSVRTQQYRLLHLAVKRSSDVEFSGIAFFKGTEIPSCGSCKELVLILENRIGGTDWEVQIRKDTWFASAFFPLFFRFEPDNAPIVYRNSDGSIVPPSVAQFYKRPQLRCRRYYKEFTCEGYGSYDHVP